MLFMNKIYLHTNNLENQLSSVKAEQEQIRERRAELMYRLHKAGMKTVRIASIYGCSRQFVQQEISKYLETQKVPA